jgi:uncharacterized protein (DUF2342 family)
MIMAYFGGPYMPDAAREAIKDALRRCREANERRNHLVHGIKSGSTVPEGRLTTVKSRSRGRSPVVLWWTPAEIREAATALLEADVQLFGAIQAVVSPEMMVIGEALAWEEHRQRTEGTSQQTSGVDEP